MKATRWDKFPREILVGHSLHASALYRRFLDKRFSRFTLAGLVSDDEPVLLRQIYVPLVLTPQAVSDQAPEEKIHDLGHEVADWLDYAVRSVRAFQARDLTDNHMLGVPPPCFFISGEAGSGKTTLATSIVTSLAGTYPDGFNRRFERFLPFPILLREVPLDRIGSLDELIGWWLAQAREVEPELAPEHVIPFLDHGYGVLLFDGLDEVGSIARRQRVLGWLNHRWVGRMNERDKPNLTLVTTRPSGFEGTKQRDLHGRTLHVAPFSVEQIRAFLTKWFELRPLSKTQRKESVESLIERLVTDDRMTSLRALARRPAYLASLAFVHGTRGALPHTRAALYDSVVDAYIDVLDRQRGIAARNWDRQEKRDVLAAVAFEAHVGATELEAKQPDADRRFAWNRTELQSAVARAIEKGKARFRTIRPEDAQELTEYYLARTGLIVESREWRYQFGHLSFQEYLAAVYALDRASGAADRAKALEKLLLDRLGKPGWVEVTLLALATDAARSQGMGHRAVLARLDPEKPEHIAFLRVVLSGEELPLGEEERKAWLLAYLLRAGGALGQADHEHFVDFEANRATIKEAWHAVADALIAGTDPVEAVVTLLPHESVYLDDDESRPLDPVEMPREWVRSAASIDGATFGARMAAFPLQGSFVPSGAREVVLGLAKARPWFGKDPEFPGIAVPMRMWLVLNAWTRITPEVLPALVARLPFGWLCVDDSSYLPATLAARWDDDRLDALVCVRRETWRSVLAVERWCAVTERHLDLHWARAQARIEAQAHDLALVLAGALARTHAQALALAQARALTLTLTLTPVWHQRQALSRNLGLAQSRTLTRALLDILDRDPRPSRSWQDRTASALSTFNLALALNQILGDPTPTPRAVIEAERTAMADPDYLGRTLTDPADRAQARTEWTDFLRSPLSPLPMLDAILATDFTEIDASTKAVTERFERTAEALLREAGAPLPEEPPA